MLPPTGQFRDRCYENQQHRASGLNLALAAIILWNTVYLARAIELLRDRGTSLTEDQIKSLSPLGWEHIPPLAMIGVVCLAVGVMTLTFDKTSARRINRKAVLFALATGACIASYTVVDGLGARQAGSILGFAVWLTIGDGLLTFVLALLWKGRSIWRVAQNNLASGFAGGAMQVGAYWIIVWALALAPMAMVSALRETSVLFAALVSTFILKEGFGVWRFVSASLVTLGLMLSRTDK